jgi:hypothetical protein
MQIQPKRGFEMNSIPKQFCRISACLLGFLVFCAGSTGCGYHFRGTGNPVGIQIESIAIPLMESTSSYLGFEPEFTRYVREEFVSHARIPLVSKKKASSLLIGKIYEIGTTPYSHEVFESEVRGDGISYEVTNSRWMWVRMSAKLVDRNTGAVIWEDRNLRDRHTFVVSPDPLATRFNQRMALRTIARRLARKMYAKTMERF